MTRAYLVSVAQQCHQGPSTKTCGASPNVSLAEDPYYARAGTEASKIPCGITTGWEEMHQDAAETELS